MEVTGVGRGDVLVVQISGEIREKRDVLSEFEDRLMCLATPAMRRGSPIVFDFSKLDYINNAGLRPIVMVRKFAKPGIRLASVPPENASVREILQLYRLDRLVPFHATVDDAVIAVMLPKQCEDTPPDPS